MEVAKSLRGSRIFETQFADLSKADSSNFESHLEFLIQGDARKANLIVLE